ncbi:MAG: class I SAM-dependent methyltransferase [Ferruginibacter sp.]|nr:class I SAM-dependent methyltransferase [Bacteroidota bacterium]MBX2918631.1 class I SAM-dependent methyltransferase [Ferruginibacter sp.]
MELINNNNKVKEIESNFFSSLVNVKSSVNDNKTRQYEDIVNSKLYNKIFWGTLPKDYTEFAKKAILNAKGTSLDIGCGSLVQTAALYANSKQNHILLDQSVEMLRIAKKRLANHNGKIPDNIKLLQADAFKLPFENETFEKIVSFGMIHCFENKTEFINEALRVLKPNGVFYFTTITSDRLFSRFYMNRLRKQKKIGEPLSSQKLLNLFNDKSYIIEYYKKGNMLFIIGIK